MLRPFITVLIPLVLVLAPAAAPAQERVPQDASEITLTFAPLVREAAPAVVNIYASRVVEARSPFQDDPIFRDFFRSFAPGRPRVQNSLGSGVILSPDGIVVSNFHVVGQATDIRVVLNDRREYSARVLLGDEEADLAILKIEGAPDLPHLELRDSDDVAVGELVLAIGNPFGVGQTVSSGIVSGLARSGTATGNARGYFIQTDAPINPGNSGGALIDVSGRLIGVNTSILTRSGGSNGIGFAIPAALVRQFVAQAEAGRESFQRPWAGLTGQPVDSDLSESLGQTVPEGILISDMHPASPFAAAGVEVGDVIVAVDGRAVNTPPEMIYRLSVRGIGATSAIEIRRRGQTLTLEVALGPAPEDPPRDAVSLDERAVLPGLTVARVNPAVIAERDLPLGTEGLVVLDPGRWGARAGLRAGDVIRAVNGRALDHPRQVAPALAAALPRIAIEVERGGRPVLLRFRA
ncbi:trypsin-like peptidase domain-containing protein [Roseivivax isoporae]|uniref:Serine protease n=1 Tax=Roseivivax isoporae LMG 25204 TaxID=1449351 RepID=X7F5T4_9RHOB|nr:trypsin-like peptidase domain-containing protein [Roseivivax isoporae]ETX27429.1 serine protease [Roseivivax isoporae LMG 25204]